jgi:hypothetical protein
MNATATEPIQAPSGRDSVATEDLQSVQTDFAKLAERAISRRRLLGAGAAVGISAFVTGSMALAPSSARAATRLGFEPVAANALDTITVPKGYGWHVLASWGDPLWSNAAAFDHQTRGTGASQERAMGDNNDGMALFGDGGRYVLAVNNEYANQQILHGNRASKKAETPDDFRKSKAAHGITVVEIVQTGRIWSIVKDSPYNRRITADTPMAITGPARGHDLLKTAADPTGAAVNGTFNNCGSGRTPWGTYLSCEENFDDYFSGSDPSLALSDARKRYGVGLKSRNAWATVDARFDIAKHPNEPNRFGYVVEVDPLAPNAMPRKRTALGRLKHENAEVALAADGRVVVYMGDDERGEYLYRFVSDGRYAEGGNNDDLLDAGRLYVAKFQNGGTGAWIELSPAAAGMASQAEVCIHTRLAASKVRATTMDRPEWVAVNPIKPEAYCCLTNNTSRGVKANAGGDEMPVGGPNPRKANPYGQIVRWRPEGGDHASPRFDWDLFVVAGNPAVHGDALAGSPNVTKENMFNAPDGLAFDANGLLWIQTDGNYSDKKDFAGQGNNQMLVGDPATGEIRRFMVGPKECEVTGFAWSPDRKALFVGIQHPGERGNGRFPGGGGTVPRSSIVAITKDDGGPVV